MKINVGYGVHAGTRVSNLWVSHAHHEAKPLPSSKRKRRAEMTNRTIPPVDTATGETAIGDISTERVHSIFANIAKKYDIFNALSSMGVYKLWLNSVVKAASATPETRMLDLAAGTGDVTFKIAGKTPPASIMSTDFCEEMLEVARVRYAQGEAGDVPCEFKMVDAQDIPFGDDVYDLVTCAYGIRNIPDRMKAFREAYRVLKPGGRYVILEFSTPHNRLWRGVYHTYLKNVIPFVGGLLTKDRSGFVYLNDSIRAFPDQETLAGYLRNVGFGEVTYEDHTGGIVAIHIAVK
jgi:demethylmenaquinone methyltransferase / 2-methoxy-6-polyprenyl-1,4-benzoquinol methylase